MKPFIQIKLNTGHVYEVPTELIAHNRAAYYHGTRPDDFPTLQSALEDTRGLFGDSTEIKEWVMGNMNPDEVLPHAKLVRFTPPDTNDAWNEGEWSYHDGQAMIGEVDGDTIMRQPLEATLNVMAASAQICNVSIINSMEGQPLAAVAVILGDNAVLSPFVVALQHVAGQFSAPQIAAASQQH